MVSDVNFTPTRNGRRGKEKIMDGIVEKLYNVGFNAGISAEIARFKNEDRLVACATALGKQVDDLDLFQVDASKKGNFWTHDAESGVVCSGHLWPNAIYLFPLYATNPPRTFIFAR
jgi:hypothetical protein